MPTHHGTSALSGLHAYCSRGHHHHDGDRFGRLFVDLPPLFTDPRVLERLGEPGGVMADHAPPDVTESVAVGMIFFGQFVDHDITLDVSSSLDTVNDPATIYDPKIPFIPVEFSVAAYRFGHSMVPLKVRLRENAEAFELFGPEFGHGFSAVANADSVADMHELFETHFGRPLQPATKCDAKLAADLLRLSADVDPDERSLATRNMVRGQSFLLPSGEAVAEELGRPEEEIEKISKAARKDEPGLGAGTPLWYYILKEAELIGREEPGTPEKRKGKGRKRSPAKNTKPGEGLGPVGATLVAEVIIGLIELDPRSWLGANRNWHPETYAHDAGVEMSTVGNLLAYGSAEAPSV